GREPHEALEDMDIGSQIQFPDGPWTIVGIYESHGRGDWTMYGDTETLMAAFRRTTFSSVTLQLADDPAAFGTFTAAVTSDPTISVSIERETDYRARIDGPSINFYMMIGYWIGAIIALGVLFAAANMTYAAVSKRTVEIGTLRAIGFGPTGIVASILIESL